MGESSIDKVLSKLIPGLDLQPDGTIKRNKEILKAGSRNVIRNDGIDKEEAFALYVAKAVDELPMWAQNYLSAKKDKDEPDGVISVNEFEAIDNVVANIVKKTGVSEDRVYMMLRGAGFSSIKTAYGAWRELSDSDPNKTKTLNSLKEMLGVDIDLAPEEVTKLEAMEKSFDKILAEDLGAQRDPSSGKFVFYSKTKTWEEKNAIFQKYCDNREGSVNSGEVSVNSLSEQLQDKTLSKSYKAALLRIYQRELENIGQILKIEERPLLRLIAERKPAIEELFSLMDSKLKVFIDSKNSDIAALANIDAAQLCVAVAQQDKWKNCEKVLSLLEDRATKAGGSGGTDKKLDKKDLVNYIRLTVLTEYLKYLYKAKGDADQVTLYDLSKGGAGASKTVAQRIAELTETVKQISGEFSKKFMLQDDLWSLKAEIESMAGDTNTEETEDQKAKAAEIQQQMFSVMIRFRLLQSADIAAMMADMYKSPELRKSWKQTEEIVKMDAESSSLRDTLDTNFVPENIDKAKKDCENVAGLMSKVQGKELKKHFEAIKTGVENDILAASIGLTPLLKKGIHNLTDQEKAIRAKLNYQIELASAKMMQLEKEKGLMTVTPEGKPQQVARSLSTLALYQQDENDINPALPVFWGQVAAGATQSVKLCFKEGNPKGLELATFGNRQITAEETLQKIEFAIWLYEKSLEASDKTAGAKANGTAKQSGTSDLRLAFRSEASPKTAELVLLKFQMNDLDLKTVTDEYSNKISRQKAEIAKPGATLEDKLRAQEELLELELSYVQTLDGLYYIYLSLGETVSMVDMRKIITDTKVLMTADIKELNTTAKALQQTEKEKLAKIPKPVAGTSTPGAKTPAAINHERAQIRLKISEYGQLRKFYMDQVEAISKQEEEYKKIEMQATKEGQA